MSTPLLELIGLPLMTDMSVQNYLGYNSALGNLYTLFDGQVSVSFAGGDVDWSGSPYQTGLYNGGYVLTGATGARNFKFPASTTWGPRLFINNSGHSITVKIGGSTGYVVPNGTALQLYSDGTDVRADTGGVAGALLAANNLSDLLTPATARTNLGLGAAAVKAYGGPLGVCPLDGSGLVPLANMPATGAFNPLGSWDATANTPTLTSSVGTNGDLYIVSVAGSHTLDGISTWNVGDWVFFGSGAWQRVPIGGLAAASTLGGFAASAFALLEGLSGGQLLNGGTAASESLTLSSTSHATKGNILFGTGSAFDDANDRIGIKTTAPSVDLGLGAGANRTIGVERHPSGGGNQLFIHSGGAVLAGTDQPGGQLCLQAGVSTGSAALGGITFEVPAVGATGTADNALGVALYIAPGGNLAVGGYFSPTAELHLAAGGSTPGTAPLKIAPGTLLSSAEVGALEYNGRFLLTDADAAQRHVVQALSSTVAGGTPLPAGTISLVIDGVSISFITA